MLISELNDMIAELRYELTVTNRNYSSVREENEMLHVRLDSSNKTKHKLMQTNRLRKENDTLRNHNHDLVKVLLDIKTLINEKGV